MIDGLSKVQCLKLDKRVSSDHHSSSFLPQWSDSSSRLAETMGIVVAGYVPESKNHIQKVYNVWKVVKSLGYMGKGFT